MTKPTSVTVRVPCSTSNLGPGLDCLGLALSLHCTTYVELNETGDVRLNMRTPPQPDISLPRPRDSAIVRAMLGLAEAFDKRLPGLAISADNRIPLASGLGSSGAFTLTGLLAANALLGLDLPREEILQRAIALEGHPDNVTPSLFGGLTISLSDTETPKWHRLEPPMSPCVLVIHPNLVSNTQAARELLPEQVSRTDAIANMSRACALVAALAGGRAPAPSLFRDRFHQTARTRDFPWFAPMLDTAEQIGAFGGFLSGSGPAVALLTSADLLAPVESAALRLLRVHGLKGTAYRLQVETHGAVLM